MKERIYLSLAQMQGAELKYIKEAFDTNWIAPLGPNVDAFEEAIMAYTGSRSAVALSSGTAAIHLALLTLGVGEGDVVLCSSFTFAGSCNPIAYVGAVPVFIDSEEETWNMDPKLLEKAIVKYMVDDRKPKACIVVNLYGQSAKMDEIVDICSKYDIKLIEDAAESLGATYRGQASGTFGHIGIYSFNGNKIITTSGGGMVVSNNPEYTKHAKYLATQARQPFPYYEHIDIGYNYRMSNVCAGIGRGQMECLDDFILKRKEIFRTYQAALEEDGVGKMMPIYEKGQPNYWLSAMILDTNLGMDPLTLVERLEAYNIEARPLWKPMHLQPIFKDCDYISKDRVCDRLYSRGICLPSGSGMTPEELSYVIQSIKEIVGVVG